MILMLQPVRLSARDALERPHLLPIHIGRLGLETQAKVEVK